MISYLISPVVQVVDINGRPVQGAQFYVYDSTTGELATVYSDDEGTVQSNPVIADLLGNVTVMADSARLYDIAVYMPDGTLLFSKRHVSPQTSAEAASETVKVAEGEGVSVTKTVADGVTTYTVSCDFDIVASQQDLTLKQDVLEAGDNIYINNTTNVISVTGRRSLQTVYPVRMVETDDKFQIYLETPRYSYYRDIVATADATVSTEFAASAMEVQPGEEVEGALVLDGLKFYPSDNMSVNRVTYTVYDGNGAVACKSETYPAGFSPEQPSVPFWYINSGDAVSTLSVSAQAGTDQFLNDTINIRFNGKKL